MVPWLFLFTYLFLSAHNPNNKKKMASDSNQPLLVICIIYACGFVIELLIRLSEGIPHPLPPIFNDNLFLLLAQPFIFILGPALFWPIASLHRLLRPIVRMCHERRSKRAQEPSGDNDNRSDTDSDSGSDFSSIDLEKGNFRTEKSRTLSSHDDSDGDMPSDCNEKVLETVPKIVVDAPDTQPQT